MQSPALLMLYASTLFARVAHGEVSSLEVLANAPPCAQNCLVSAFASAACDPKDVGACVCLNDTIQSKLSICTQTSCSYMDQASAAAMGIELCSAFPKASKSAEIIRIAVAGCVLVFPVIALRLYTRVVYTKKLWMDDYATVVATMLLAILAGVVIFNAQLGLGTHYWTIPVDRGILILKLIYFESMVYMLLVVASKISILLVYARIFPTPRFQLAVRGLSAFLICHGLVYFLLTAFQCLPISSVWDRSVTNRKCLSANAIVYSSGVLSILEDAIILLLPVRHVWQLNIDRRRRLLLLALFSVGIFACITSVVRMKYIVQYSTTLDGTWDTVDIAVWSTAEQFSAMLCGSLPALRPLLVHVMPRIYSNVRAKMSRVQSLGRSSSRQSIQSIAESLQGERPHFADQSHAFGKHEIRVTTTVEVKSESGTWLEMNPDVANDIERGTCLQHPLPVYSK